ncbi:MAG: hypothetical protein IJJ43_03565 [Oscillospiraceae bacterium]|nr:hypothetical protein [Oscillospiraceae bacterium]
MSETAKFRRALSNGSPWSSEGELSAFPVCTAVRREIRLLSSFSVAIRRDLIYTFS